MYRRRRMDFVLAQADSGKWLSGFLAGCVGMVGIDVVDRETKETMWTGRSQNFQIDCAHNKI